MDLKQFTVMASGKMRQCAYDALKDKVNLLSWQQGGRMPQEQFDAWLSQADAIFSISNFKANEELLAKAPKLKVIAQSAVGYDNIDVAACNAHGVRVGNTPGVLVDDYEAAHAKHKEMGCICYENPAMGIYFIIDPDNYWLEIVPKK